MDAVLVLAMALEQAGLVLVATRGRQDSAVGAFGVI